MILRARPPQFEKHRERTSYSAGPNTQEFFQIGVLITDLFSLVHDESSLGWSLDIQSRSSSSG